MTFRGRLAVASAAAVGLAVTAASLIIYFAEQNDLHEDLNERLRARATEVSRALDEDPLGSISPPAFGGPGGYAQVISASGAVTHFSARPFLPVSAAALQVASGEVGSLFEDVFARGAHVRMLTTAVGEGRAVQVARPLDELDEALRDLRALLVVVTLGGLVVGGLLGLLSATAALVPVGRLTTEAERMSATLSLDARIEVSRKDELGRLARSFNTLLAALESSLGAQRQLVADASHELRTPLTSLQTNIEILSRGDLPQPERLDAMKDARRELQSLAALVNDIIDLARADEAAGQDLEVEEVAVDEVVREAVTVALRRHPQADMVSELEPCLVRGDPALIARAVDNLLENAITWSRGRPVEVTVREGAIMVRDHGTGIPPDELPRVFDRFYRASSADGSAGSGLGLAIVRSICERHGWGLTAENADGAGMVFRVDWAGRSSSVS